MPVVPSDRGNVRIAGRLALDKSWFEDRLGAIEIDSLKEDDMTIVCIHGGRGYAASVSIRL
jgi:hypothetical protein